MSTNKESLAGPVKGHPTRFNRYMYETRFRPFTKLVEACCHVVPEPSRKDYRVLDVGCGTGLMTHLFRVAGFEAYGCDIVPNSEANEFFLEEHGERLIFELDVNDLIDHDSSWDLITMANLPGIFSDEALKHLINIFSNKATTVMLQLRPNQAHDIVQYCGQENMLMTIDVPSGVGDIGPSTSHRQKLVLFMLPDKLEVTPGLVFYRRGGQGNIYLRDKSA